MAPAMAELADAKSRHLDGASRALMLSSPALSAWLQSRKMIQAGDINDQESNDASGGSCATCDNILIPGWSSSIERIPGHGQNKGKISKKNNTDKSKPIINRALVCKRCNARTSLISRTPRPARARASQPDIPALDESKLPINISDSSLSNAQAVNTQNHSESTTSRKKRIRGKNSGLQALLEKTKSGNSTPKTPGLDFFDFLKNG